MPTFSVLTPTYNRVDTLERAYRSLLQQTGSDFEWLVVDDGSTDATPALLERLAAAAPFPVTVHRQDNAGKHAAVNRGVALARGPLLLILDSDDWLLPGGLECLEREWRSMSDDQRAAFAGVAGRSVTADGALIGSPLPAPVLDSDEIELRWRYRVTGDNAGFMRTDLMRAHPFPERDRYVSEGLVWNRIARNYRTRYLDQPVQGKEYRPDGLTDRSASLRMASAESARIYYEELVGQRHRMVASSAWRHAANHTRFALHAGRTLDRTAVPGATLWWLASLPAGVALAWRDRRVGTEPGPRRRLLMVSQPTVGGAATCVRDLTAAATGAGWLVTVACPREGDLAGWAQAAGANWQPLPLHHRPAPADLAAIATVRRLARHHDVVHLHSSKAGAVGRLARVTSLRSPRPVVFTPHGWSWLGHGALGAAYSQFERVAARWADVIIAVSEADAEAGAAVLGRHAQAVRVIANGVDPIRFSPDGTRASRSDDPLVVVVGRLTRAKGQDLAIRALALMQTPSVRLRLVGDGEDRVALEDLAAHLGVADRIEFAGDQPDPDCHQRAADVVAVPSRWDGQSIALLEAMSCGAAVVATEVNGSAAVDGAGVRVAPEDPDALATALDALLADPDRRRRLGAGARRRVLEEFRFEDSATAHLALWASMLPDERR